MPRLAPAPVEAPRLPQLGSRVCPSSQCSHTHRRGAHTNCRARSCARSCSRPSWPRLGSASPRLASRPSAEAALELFTAAFDRQIRWSGVDYAPRVTLPAQPQTPLSGAASPAAACGGEPAPTGGECLGSVPCASGADPGGSAEMRSAEKVRPPLHMASGPAEACGLGGLGAATQGRAQPTSGSQIRAGICHTWDRPDSGGGGSTNFGAGSSRSDSLRTRQPPSGVVCICLITFYFQQLSPSSGFAVPSRIRADHTPVAR